MNTTGSPRVRLVHVQPSRLSLDDHILARSFVRVTTAR